MNHKVNYYRYWPKHKPIPSGWVKTGNMEDSHHGEWSIMIMEAKKLYYTDPLKAAWMAREFGVVFISSCTDDTLDWENDFCEVSPQGWNCSKLYIHPDSLSIFEPMEGDVGESEDGQLVEFRKGEWVQIDGHDLAQYHPPVGKISIIRRDKKSFEAPEEQA